MTHISERTEKFRVLVGKYNTAFGAYYCRYRKQLIIASLLLLLNAFLIMPAPMIIRRIVDIAIPNADSSMLLKLALLCVSIYVTMGVTGYVAGIMFYNLNSQIMIDLRLRLLKKYAYSQFEIFNQHSADYMLSRISQDPGYINTLFGDQLVILLRDVLIFMASITGMFLVSIRLAVAAAVLFPLLAVLTVRYSSRMKQIFTEFLENRALEISTLQESLRFLGFLKRSNRESAAAKRYFRSAIPALRNHIEYGKHDQAHKALTAFFASIIPLLTFVYGGVLVINGSLTIGALVAFNAYIVFLYTAVNSLLNTNITMQVATSALDRVIDVLKFESESVDGSFCPEKIEIRFENVHFRYSDETQVFHNLNISFEKDNLIGLVGESGAGKTTLFDIILGVYKIQEGKYLVNGEEVDSSRISALRSSIALVEQEPLLLKSSIRENIMLLNPGATFEEVVCAAREMNLHELIMSQQNQYETIVDKASFDFSVGQKQRLAIGRAILRKPKILLLDEITSSQDTGHESMIVEHVKKLSESMKVIVIAHRLSTMKYCDRIHVIADGCVAESGTHSSLMAMPDKYYKFVKANTESDLEG
ncbi:MAG: ABC transporter ATP-binding protein [Candidatus Sabulitectum sp.]|nr:ABC transporter ATP-binding protein [Candidatus Sabulitectum sp.]